MQMNGSESNMYLLLLTLNHNRLNSTKMLKNEKKNGSHRN